MTAHDTPYADPLDAAQVAERLRRYERDIDKSFGPPETIPYPMAYEFGEWADAIAALSQQLSEARAELKNRWQRMDSAPRDGTRILLAWEPYSGISEHVELGKWKSQNGWCNTYGKPFSGEPDAWAALAPFSLSPEAAEAKLATTRCALEAAMGHFGDDMADAFIDFVQSREATALSKRDAPQAQAVDGWRYEIQHGPEGETDYAWVYRGKEMICTTKTHHAIAIVSALTRPSTTEAKPVEALLREFAEQRHPLEMAPDERDGADWEGACAAFIEKSRAILSKEQRT